MYQRKRTSPRQWKSQHRRQRDRHARVGLAGLRGDDGRSSVHGYLRCAQQPGFRVAIPDRVPVGSRLAFLFTLGKRVQRIPVDRRSSELHFRSDFSGNRTQDNHSSAVFRAQFFRSVDNGRHRTGNNASSPVTAYQIHIAQRQPSAVYDCERSNALVLHVQIQTRRVGFRTASDRGPKI